MLYAAYMNEALTIDSIREGEKCFAHGNNIFFTSRISFSCFTQVRIVILTRKATLGMQYNPRK